MAQQRGVKHIFHQRRFARTGNAYQHGEAVERNVQRQVLQVAKLHARQPHAGGETFRQGGHGGRRDLLATGKIFAGQRVGVRGQFRWCCLRHDLPAACARAGAKFNQPVGSAQKLRVVLHHHQRVARIAQALHDAEDAFGVIRVQTGGRLVKDKQRIDQRRAQRRGQVDALQFAARERARLPFQRQIT